MNKTYYINHKEVTRELFIFGLVRVISDGKPNNSVSLRNKIYSEVNSFISIKEKEPDNFTISIDLENLFHIIEKKENLESEKKT